VRCANWSRLKYRIGIGAIAIDFKGCHYPKHAILYAVFFYVRYAVSYRDLEEIMAERGGELDHSTLNRWVVKFSPLIAIEAQKRKQIYAWCALGFSQWMWIRGVSQIGIGVASFHLNAAPFYVMLIMLIFGYGWSWLQSIGACILAVGVIMAQSQLKRDSTAKSTHLS
jgi:hypothetical protein